MESKTVKHPETLYHYCSVAALRGIISDNCLHMTSILWMDDTTEMSWLVQVIRELIETRPAEEQTRLRERFESLQPDTVALYPHVYCACFSQHEDSRSQWLEYADNGRGFALGLATDALLELSPRFDESPHPRRPVELAKVIYDEEQQKRIANETLDALLKASEEKLQSELARFFNKHNVWWYAPRCKKPVFHEENEWRVIAREDPGKQLHFRNRGRAHLIPYLIADFKPESKPIREIWFGPRCDLLNRGTLELLLRNAGYPPGSVAYSKSKVPLRPEYGGQG